MKNDFADKVVVITGSGRGIGLAAAKEFARRGAKIVLNGRDVERLEAARESLAADGREVIAVPADVSQPEGAEHLIKSAIEKFGRCDILVNNAGVSMRAEFETLTPEDCRRIVDINLMGCIYPTLFAMPEIRGRKGSIIFISSIAGLIGLPTGSLYCATKTALRGFADSLRCEVGALGVHIGVVYVGFTENDPTKTVIGVSGESVSPSRPAHMTQAQVASAIADTAAKRRRETVLSPVGKLAQVASRLSPELVESTIIFSRKTKLNEKLGIR